MHHSLDREIALCASILKAWLECLLDQSVICTFLWTWLYNIVVSKVKVELMIQFGSKRVIFPFNSHFKEVLRVMLLLFVFAIHLISVLRFFIWFWLRHTLKALKVTYLKNPCWHIGRNGWKMLCTFGIGGSNIGSTFLSRQTIQSISLDTKIWLLNLKVNSKN